MQKAYFRRRKRRKKLRKMGEEKEKKTNLGFVKEQILFSKV